MESQKSENLISKAHENTPSENSSVIQFGLTFYNFTYGREKKGVGEIKFENTDIEIPQAQNRMKFSFLVESVFDS